MLEAARDAQSFANGRTREELAADRMLLMSLERAVEIVGEAASKVSAGFRASRPDLPWAAMIGMRNRLVHAYFDINPLHYVDYGFCGPTVADRATRITAR